MDAETAAKALTKALWFFEAPNDQTHPYYEVMRGEQEDDPTVARSPAVQAIMDVANVTEHLETILPELMAIARDEGDTWEQIGESAGISRQAAQQRVARWER